MQDTPFFKRILVRLINFRLMRILALKKAETENDLKRQARLRSMSAKYAGGWIRVLPSKSLSLDFKPQEFLILLKLWLGLPQLPSGHAFTCNQCGVQLDTLGYHALTCKSRGDLIYRHNTIRDAINKAYLMAGWTPQTRKSRPYRKLE